MEVILKKDVPNLGRLGDVVNVKPGYARNFLIPREMAVTASLGQKRHFEHQKRMIEALKKKVRKESEEKIDSFKTLKIKLKKRFNETGKMFGSVSAIEVLSLLNEKGYSFDKRDLSLPMIKGAGSYSVKLRLPGDVMTEFQLEIDAQNVTEKKSKKKSSSEATESLEAAEESESVTAEAAIEAKEE